MGIRIKKMLGYGLTNLTTDHGELRDNRINPGSPLLHRGPGMTEATFLAWLDTHDTRNSGTAGLMRGLRSTATKDFKMDPADSIAYDTEHGLPNVLCLRPIWLPDWSRTGDSIDYAQESTHGTDGHVRVFDDGIFPFAGSYMDDRDGHNLGAGISEWARANALMQSIAVTAPQFGKDGIEALDGFARRGGFTDHQDALNHVAPAVPEEVRLLAEYGDLFTNPDVWIQLRPMIYTWWA